jgi:tetratricopeptide (TPR) repeat protein
MGDEFSKHYEQGLGYQRLENYHAAAECFKKATLIDKHRPESWYEAGFTLIQIQRLAEAGMYLRRALAEYEREIQLEKQKDFNYYQKACALALLNENQEALQALATSVTYNPFYAEIASNSLAFIHLYQNDDFQSILREPLVKLEQMRFRGKKVRQSELSALSWINRQKFLSTLHQEGWKTEDFKSIWENDQALSPQVTALYQRNEALLIQLSYYLDEELIFMEMRNRGNEENSQAYRIYLGQKPDTVLEVITRFQSKVDFQNWEDFMEALIDVCKSLLFEMPDGRKVKVS